MVEIVGGILIGLLAALPIRRLLRWHLEARQMRRLYMDRFFDTAQRLAVHADLDDTHVAELRYMADNLAGAAPFRRMLRELRQLEIDVRNGTDNRWSRENTPASIRSEWMNLTYAYLMTLSYDRTFLGAMLRDRLPLLLDPDARERADCMIRRQVVAAA